MGRFANWRRELGARLYGRSAIVADIAHAARLSNPILPAFFGSTDAGQDNGRGYEPLDQNFAAYMDGLGLFPILSACDDAIGNYAAAVPYALYRGEDTIDEHPLLDLLADPNPEQGYAQWWYALAQQWGTTGNVYISCVGTPEIAPWANPQELWVLPSHRTRPVPDKTRRRKGKSEAPVAGYIYDADGGGRVDFLPSQVLHIKRPHPRDPMVGLSPRKELETTLNLLFNSMAWNNGYFKNGANPGLVFRKEAGLATDALKRFMDQTDQSVTGVAKARANLYLTGGWTAEKMGNSPEEASFLGLVDLMVKWILAVRGVPPFAIGLLEHANWSNSVEQQRYFYDRAIKPFNQAMFDAMNSHAMVQVWGEDLMLCHDYSGIDALSEDRDAQAARAATLYRNQIATKDEARIIVGLDPLGPGAGGEDFYSPSSPFGGFADADMDAQEDAESGRLAFRRLVAEARTALAAGKREDARAKRWLAAVRRTESFESTVRSRMRGLFREMKGEALEELARRAGVAKLAGEKDKGVDPKWGERLFDPAAWKERAMSRLLDTLVAAIRAGHEDITEEATGAYLPFNVDRAEVQEFIARKTAKSITTVANHRLTEIEALVREAAADGRTVDELATSLREWFGHDVSWSQRIARTEVHQLYEEGSLLGMRDAGVTTKQWLTARDAFVRDSHREADGQEVPLDSDFIVGGHAGKGPGQIGVPEEDIQCRCTTVAGGF